jgi:hypothetical protein
MRERFGVLVGATARLATLGQEPTNEALSRASGLTPSQVDRYMRSGQLARLPAALLFRGVEGTFLEEPRSVYLKSWVEPAKGPDKYGVDHPVPPNIDAAAMLTGKYGVRQTSGATSHAYSIGICGDQAVVCGETPLREGWWGDDKWRALPERMRPDIADVRDQLRRHAGDGAPSQFATGPADITVELTDQLAQMRDEHEWLNVHMRRTAVQSGWIRSGFTDDPDGHGSKLSFLGGDLESLAHIDSQDLSPLLDLPQGSRALAGRSAAGQVRWDLPWEFMIGEHTVDDRVLQMDLLHRVDGNPAPRWWRTPDRVVMLTLDAEHNCRYDLIRCRARQRRSGDPWRQISLLVRRDHRYRMSGWVTTKDLTDPEVQGRLIREAELDVGRHKPDGALETTMKALLEDGYAQRTKRRKFVERKTFASTAITARTMLDLIARA